MDVFSSLTYRLSKIATATRAEVERNLEDLGLHAGQVFVLFELWKADGQSQIELASSLRLAAPTVNRMIKNLVSGGFVTSESCGIDGRVKRVYLTDRGRAVENEVLQRWQRIEERVYRGLSPAECLMAGLLFDKIQAELQDDSPIE